VLGNVREILMTFSDHPRELLTKHFNIQVEVMPGGQGKQNCDYQRVNTEANIAGILTKLLGISIGT
jgi:hypothetical protein